MADVVREEHVHEDHHHDSGNNLGMIIGAIVLVLVLILFFYYGLPFVRNFGAPAQVNVPDQVDVNVNEQ